MTENRVLSIAETAALPDGAQVYVEMAGRWHDEFSGVHTKEGQQLTDIFGAFDIGGPGHKADCLRVWSLPEPPTAAELAENPWPRQRRRNDEKGE